MVCFVLYKSTRINILQATHLILSLVPVVSVFGFLFSRKPRRDKDAVALEEARSRIAELENKLCESKDQVSDLEKRLADSRLMNAYRANDVSAMEAEMVQWREAANGSQAMYMNILKHAINIMEDNDSGKKAALRRYVHGRLRPGDDLALPFL